jgi:membrane AbrB-like protein
MEPSQTRSEYLITAYTLAAGAIGAGLGYLLSFPVFVLTGPAILITALSLTGLRVTVATPVRDAALLLIGVGIGAGVNSQATAAFLRWPVAFLVLAIMLFCIMYASRLLLVRAFNYDPRTAVLSATPGHLSFVLSMGAALNVNVAQIAVVQSVRLFSLTMFVPFAAIAFGIEINGFPPLSEPPMEIQNLLILILLGLGLGLILQRLKVPAPLLIGGLIVSTAAHITELSPGPMHPAIALPGFAVIGTLIGTRFSGVSLSLLKSSLLAGLATTAIAVLFAVLAALPVAAFLDMPLPHVLVAFAPGGLETMIAMGAVLGANPGFVAACHVARLLMLIVLVPMMLPKRRGSLKSDRQT